ncbi:hypothetical protein LCGC14_2193100 [marine sediment metagenome]|uniref:Uncharacterized protein n=1 Tax=marine sediment metagenome TaxID=412755 RepID=A0A0F9GEP0_9ZZZZ
MVKINNKIELGLYMITWSDAIYNLDPNKENVKLPLAADFGFILEANDEYLVLGTEVFTNGHVRQAMTFPRGTILGVKKVVTITMPKLFESPPTLL